ncbi:MAG: D-sedoheptulose 7-phosphate isomerase [Deltaproteobacteria bacterium]|nr:D-sedoheptulose 7-phosphate isomerase [Deltaproteobacteria bacterium]
MKKTVEEAMTGHRKMVEAVKGLQGKIVEVAEIIARSLRQGGKVLVMGNGGSAADAQHLAAEFVGRFLRERKALPAISLSTDTSILTALGNDYGYDAVFLRQVEALAVSGDVVIGISTSGNSENVIRALEKANKIGCSTIGLAGGEGGAIAGAVDLSLVVPVPDTPRIQEGHILMIHILCDLVEQEFV